MHTSQKIGARPAYFDNQLLQADDFIAEQRFHIQARRRHNLALHDVGVVSGLEVGVDTAGRITVRPGYAIDHRGQEIELAQACTLDAKAFAPRTLLRVSLNVREDKETEREHRNRIEMHAVLALTDAVDDPDALLLATLRLDGDGKADPASVDASGARRARTRLAPGSVGVTALADELRRGWTSMPFRGWPLEPGPDGNQSLPPPFRYGTTETRSHSLWHGQENKAGGGGTMPVPIPFGARRILRMRLAGVDNDSGLDVRLILGGFDAKAGLHVRRPLVEATITAHPYSETFTIADGALDPEWHTLALWIRSKARASISLVSFEFAH